MTTATSTANTSVVRLTFAPRRDRNFNCERRGAGIAVFFAPSQIPPSHHFSVWTETALFIGQSGGNPPTPPHHDRSRIESYRVNFGNQRSLIESGAVGPANYSDSSAPTDSRASCILAGFPDITMAPLWVLISTISNCGSTATCLTLTMSE